MRYMMSIMSDPRAEADTEMGPEIFEAMAAYNEELVKAGVLLAGDGLAPSTEALRVTFSDGRARVTDGPFAEAKEFIAGYWIIQVSSPEEAVEWAKRCPHPPAGDPTEMHLILRRIMDTDDFGDEMSEELKERERELREHNAHEAHGG
ncbi:YciI family protein [Nocardiopsis lambiniae]|uniref:YciI family protein n=1 Tax=Nocardiopsis lambiniae TaxID=3075539 RepID=A0ABU2M602_9ACTN|nr:YciI family protein [Nocardiopsis sp. DSM 44743]MDT0328094.1 YciI family protein [Nocardiopsis sp. DSM 44743]